MNTKRKGTIRFCTLPGMTMGGIKKTLHSNGAECRRSKGLRQKIDPILPHPVPYVMGVSQKYFGVFKKKEGTL
tara:strand:+ start:314 stop:532 length:219 start_codon:yes stop_codon:yes gene_type:complete